MHIQPFPGYAPVTAPLLALLEEAIQAPLPDDYKALLLEHNGGTWDPEPLFATGVPFRRGVLRCHSQLDTVRTLFGLALPAAPPATPRALLTCNTHPHSLQFGLRLTGTYLPPEVMPIMRCVSNSLLCLSLAPESHGRIYYWDYCYDFPWSKAYYADRLAALGPLPDPARARWLPLTPLADTVTAFLAILAAEVPS